MRRSRKPFIKNNVQKSNVQNNCQQNNRQQGNTNGSALKIYYTDITGQLVSAIVSFKDTYENKISPKENFERAVFEIISNGAFWLTDTKIIPLGRIAQFVFLPPQQYRNQNPEQVKVNVPNPKPEVTEVKKIDFGDNLTGNNLSDNKEV